MKLDIKRNKNETYYYLSKSIRVGKKSVTQRLQLLGKHSELIKLYDDPVSHLKSIVTAKNEAEKAGNVEITITRYLNKDLNHGDDISNNKLLNVGYFFLDALYRRLNMDAFFREITQESKITYSPNEVTKYLTFARILDPKSKLSTFDDFKNYYGSPDIDIQNVYRTLDILYDNLDRYQTHLYQNSLKISNRNTHILYYDCTNYFFEIETEDDFRKYGQSKDHKPNPIVQMGLFMDGDGIPLAFKMTAGNTNEQKTVIPLERQIIKDFELSKLIYVADAGLNSNDIKFYNSMPNRDYIVTQSIKKLSRETQDLILTDDHWQSLKNERVFRSISSIGDSDEDTYYKVMWVDNPIDIGLQEITRTGRLKKKTSFKQRLIVTYSKKHALYQARIRAHQILRADQMIKDNAIDRTPINSPKRFAKNTGASPVYDLDLERISDESKYDGYYALVTSLEEDKVPDILKASGRRWEIEESFRILKTNFKSRPVYHQKERRIVSHFAICFTALLIYRLLEKKLDNKYTVNEIIKQLKMMNVYPLSGTLFESTYTGSKLLDDLCQLNQIPLNKESYFINDLNKMLKK